MQRSPSGIWVPSHGPSNKFTAHDVKPENRRFLHGRLPTDDFQQAYSFPEHWKSHARARIDGCAEVITKVAVLKARNGINDSEPIVCTGAVYQDFRGAPKYHQRAHRFPCNPWIGVFTLPELALRVSRAMWVEMVNPLAATDIVPNYVNSGDTGIEGNGTYRAMQSALREVIQEQKSGRSVNPKLIQHVLMFSLLPKLRESIGLALEGVQKKSRSQWDDALQGASAFSPEGVEALNRSSIETKPDPAKSAQAAYLTEEYLQICARDASVYQPHALQRPVLESQLERLQSLPAADSPEGS